MPSLSFIVVAPFFAFAGHAGGPAGSAADDELPEQPELVDVEVSLDFEATVPFDVAGG